jgi:hypothetical protein
MPSHQDSTDWAVENATWKSRRRERGKGFEKSQLRGKGFEAHLRESCSSSDLQQPSMTGVSDGGKFDSCGGRKSDSRQHGLAAG